MAMLNGLSKTATFVFGKVKYNSFRGTSDDVRKRIAQKLKNPRLLQIHFHTLRHWKATMLYQQTKDTLYVKKFLGHKNVENTLVYIQLEEALFQESDEWTVRVAETVNDVVKLLEADFEYVTDWDDKNCSENGSRVSVTKIKWKTHKFKTKHS
jgi:integrase